MRFPNLLKSYHLHNEHQATEKVIGDLQSGQNIAIITDAGTPGISDPGYLLARAGSDNNIEMICLPGATALIPALVVSGLPNNEFLFAGFLPQKKEDRPSLSNLRKRKNHCFIRKPTQDQYHFGADQRILRRRNKSQSEP